MHLVHCLKAGTGILAQGFKSATEKQANWAVHTQKGHTEKKGTWNKNGEGPAMCQLQPTQHAAAPWVRGTWRGSSSAQARMDVAEQATQEETLDSGCRKRMTGGCGNDEAERKQVAGTEPPALLGCGCHWCVAGATSEPLPA